MVRRLKEDLRAIDGGFPERVVRQIDLVGLPDDTPELRLSHLLDRYRAAREARLAGESKRTQAVAALLLSGLQQRLLSSVEAFVRTLRVHQRTAHRLWDQDATNPTSRRGSGPAEPTLFAGGIGSDDDRAALPEDDLRVEEEAEIEAATLGTGMTLAARASPGVERQLLDEMMAIAEAARGLPDARIAYLVDWIRANQCPDLGPSASSPSVGRPSPARWNATRVLIFTEYDDTKRYIQQQLAAAIAATDRADERIEVYHGPTPRAEREEIKRAFTGDPARHPVRILIATDAAREGINLQTHCWNLFHFDVPWNPSRLEQRNGRIDRKLQPSLQVFCHYFVYRQRPEDRILEVLVRKTEIIRRELGSLAQVLEGRLARALREGVRHAEVDQIARELVEARPDAEARQVVEAEFETLARERREDLKAQIHRLQGTLKRSQDWLGLDPPHFRAAISAALELLQAEPLRPVAADDPDAVEPAVPRYRFPALDARAGGDASWADAMDALRAPRRRDQKLWEWRRDSPVRPVVFEDTGTMAEDTVHLHLSHRVVTRLLGQFTAQGFVHHDLTRACVGSSRDAIPRVILMGRLCLYGPGAARLHEELVPLAARWVEPTLRKEGLVPYQADAESRTLQLLETALLPHPARAIDPVVVAKLQAAAAEDVAQLLPLLENRGHALAEGAIIKLRERAEAEANDMTTILQDQQRRIASKLGKSDSTQLLLGFNDDERQQLEADRRFWAKRLDSIAVEITSEPARIRALYEVKARRVEPVGLIYLWPTTG